MALDRFVFWNEEKPTRKELQQILEDYINIEGAVLWDTDRFMVTLPGKPLWLFQGVVPEKYRKMYPPERWFEVWLGKDCIDVLTRRADNFTDALAETFAVTVARYYQAKYEGD